MAIGYHEATLAGVGGDGTVIGQEVHVDLGKTGAKNVQIFADVLYLQPGATYDFTEKNITIVARRLAMSSAKDARSTISVNGVDGTSYPKDPAPIAPFQSAAAHGSDALDASNPSSSGKSGATGQSGTNGRAGGAGTAAGTIQIYTYEIGDKSSQLKLDVTANGGKGGHGQNGGTGQDGQDGGRGGNGCQDSIDFGARSVTHTEPGPSEELVVRADREARPGPEEKRGMVDRLSLLVSPHFPRVR